MPTALISVWDKNGIIDAARRLAGCGVELLSTGGTARAIAGAGIAVHEVSDVTGFPEILDGRVKTLHPAIHAGLLARRDVPAHIATLERLGLPSIDILISNLYPFAEVARQPHVTDADAIEHIDIGGPAMVRAAAKNHLGVLVLVDPDDYDRVLSAIERGGIATVDASERRALAARAFAHVAVYDSLVAAYLRQGDHSFPKDLPVGLRLLHPTRYGENPHQAGAVYEQMTPGPSGGVASWTIHEGREMSYNNYLDASAAWGCAQDFVDPTVVIVKHTLPCGIGSGVDTAQAYDRALSGDPVSAFGGIMASNRVIDDRLVDAIGKQRFDIVIGPDFTPSARERLLKRKNLRVVTAHASSAYPWEFRSIPGGVLVQEIDRAPVDPTRWVCRTRRSPSPAELTALEYAWRAVRWVKSNAIVLAQPGVVVGVGAGQPNRVESVRIAARVAGDRARSSCLASDAFFPFPDGIEAAADAGVTAIVQPGGSVRDDECIATADARGLTMLFTGERHFRH